MGRLILLSLVFVGSAVLADLTEDVRCREIGFSKSVEAGDAERFASFLDEDARFVGLTVMHGPSAITEAWSVFFAEGGPTIKWRPKIVEVLEDGKLALSRGPFRVVSKDDKGVESESWGTFNSVWRLHDDGEWRVVFDAGSSEAESPADDVKALLDQEDSCDQS